MHIISKVCSLHKFKFQWVCACRWQKPMLDHCWSLMPPSCKLVDQNLWHLMGMLLKALWQKEVSHLNEDRPPLRWGCVLIWAVKEQVLCIVQNFMSVRPNATLVYAIVFQTYQPCSLGSASWSKWYCACLILDSRIESQQVCSLLKYTLARISLNLVKLLTWGLSKYLYTNSCLLNGSED